MTNIYILHNIIANVGSLNVSPLNHCLGCYFVLGITFKLRKKLTNYYFRLRWLR